MLQRDIAVPVWGEADPDEQIHVTFRGQSIATKADAKGVWRATLASMHASADATDLVITGTNTVVLHDVLVGDVWLCSGQSNMEMMVKDAMNADAEIAAASYPLIRHFKVGRAYALAPVTSVRGNWEVCTPRTVGSFSAVGYFYARELHRVLGIPVGLVNSSCGNTPIEAWMSETALLSDPDFAAVYRRWGDTLHDYPVRLAAYRSDLAKWTSARDAAKASTHPFDERAPRTPAGPLDQWTTTALFSGMVAPLIPYGLRGAIWYQGENNTARADEYHKLFAAMITDWRRRWGEGDFPFYFVQLANYKANDPNGTEWAFLRAAQTQTLALPSTGMAVTIDIGNRENIHPTNKQELGRRLALIALDHTYAKPVVNEGPLFKAASPEGTSLRITFTTTSRLTTADGTAPRGFEIAGEDHVFRPATARIESDAVVVWSPEIPTPVAVRYAWRNAPDATLCNNEGLPAVPFRTDTW